METTSHSTWHQPDDVARAFGVPVPDGLLFAERIDFARHGASARVLFVDGEHHLQAVEAWQLPDGALTGQWHPYRTTPRAVRQHWSLDPDRRTVLEPLLAHFAETALAAVPDRAARRSLAETPNVPAARMAGSRAL